MRFRSKRPPRAKLPAELELIEQQIGRGWFRFHIKFFVSMKNGTYGYVKGSTAIWQARTIEEVLTAIEAAKAAITASPGVETTLSRREVGGAKCPACNRWVSKTKKHRCPLAITKGEHHAKKIDR